MKTRKFSKHMILSKSMLNMQCLLCSINKNSSISKNTASCLSAQSQRVPYTSNRAKPENLMKFYTPNDTNTKKPIPLFHLNYSDFFTWKLLFNPAFKLPPTHTPHTQTCTFQNAAQTHTHNTPTKAFFTTSCII